jgi:hypothetical protein
MAGILKQGSRYKNPKVKLGIVENFKGLPDSRPRLIKNYTLSFSSF